MQSAEQATGFKKVQRMWKGVRRPLTESVMERLTETRSPGEGLAELAHDARNMVTALGLYCDLLEEPGVLAPGFAHYAGELRLVASASRRLVERLAASEPVGEGLGSATATIPSNRFMEARKRADGVRGDGRRPGAAGRELTAGHGFRSNLLPPVPVANLAAELMSNRNLLTALAGPAVTLTMETAGSTQPVRLTGEDLTRLLVNLVKNAAEAMPAGGRVHIGLGEASRASGAASCLQLTVEDNGPGIPEKCLERIFTAGYSTRTRTTAAGGWPRSYQGLGLAIVRSIVEGAGGRIAAANRPQGGARFTIELPVQNSRDQGLSAMGSRENP